MKRIFLAIFLMAFLMFSSCEIVSAADYVNPLPMSGCQYIETLNDPNGGSLVKVDEDLNGTCDFAVIFVLQRGPDGKIYSIPSQKMSCEKADEIIPQAQAYWESKALEPMVYDRDLKKLVPVRHRNL
jgi:hypothetical protein